MKKFILLFSLVALIFMGYATNVVPVSEAMKVSRNFLSERMGSMEAQNLELTLTYTQYDEEGNPLFYRFQVGEKGFIIISATELASPVLAYSLESNYQTGTGADFYCEKFTDQISYLIQNPEASVVNKADWDRYKSFTLNTKSVKKAPYVEPLITTEWDQYPYYNQYCPATPYARYSEGSLANNDCRALVGCVAVTMGNIMNYYRYPTQGYGRHMYLPREMSDDGELLYAFPLQDVNFGESTYNYDAIPRKINNEDKVYHGELAKLLYHCGVSVDMKYGSVSGSGGSGSQTEKALESMQNYFSYSQAAQYKRITDVVTSTSTAHKWIDLAKEELDARRPIFFAGTCHDTVTGGHAWIVDGYTTLYDTTYTTTNYTHDSTVVVPQTITLYDTLTHMETLITYDTISHLDSLNNIVIDSINTITTPVTIIDTIIGYDTIVYVNQTISVLDSTVTTPNIHDATYFHTNWGWGGSGNGFFLLTNQISASYGNFNLKDSEQMLIKLCPGDSTDVVKPAVSNVRVTSSAGTISDGAGNMKYAKNSHRTWVLACPDADTYTLQFSKIKLKEGDKVIIYNGGTEASGIKQTYTGSYRMRACSDYSSLGDAVHGDFPGQNLPGAVNVKSDSVLVVFTSAENSETDYGFVLNFKVSAFKSTNTCAAVEMMTSNWHDVITDKPGDEVGNNDSYRANSICTWIIRLPFTVGYTFAFEKFDLGAGDFVDLYDITDSDNPMFISRYDIYNMPTLNTAFNVDKSKVMVKFVSDTWEQGSGFELGYWQIAGVNDRNTFQDVNLYPNPASEKLNVAISTNEAQTIHAKVVDVTGKVVFTDRFNHSGSEQIFTIPVNNMSKGVYFLNLESDKGNAVYKFIVR
jgi:hypothetical protein